jgi:hypothetical protein
MEKFSIGGEDEEYEFEGINPVFMPSLSKYVMAKGTLVDTHSSKVFKCIVFQTRKGLAGLILKGFKEVNRVLGFEDEYIYGYEPTRHGLKVQEVWFLRRLLRVEIEKKDPQQIKFFFANKSLSPVDPIKVKKIKIENSAFFLQKLKNHLGDCDIDLEF